MNVFAVTASCLLVALRLLLVLRLVVCEAPGVDLQDGVEALQCRRTSAVVIFVAITLLAAVELPTLVVTCALVST